MATDKEIKKIQLDLDELLLSVDIDDKNNNIYNLERIIQELNANYNKIDDRNRRARG